MAAKQEFASRFAKHKDELEWLFMELYHNREGLEVLALKPRHGEPLDQSAADCIITRLMDVKEHLD